MANASIPSSPHHGEKNRRTGCLVWVLAVVAILTGLLALPYLLGRVLLVNDRLRPADAAAALGGDAGSARMEQAAALYREGLVQSVIIPETNGVADNGMRESQYLLNQALAQGVRYRDIVITEVDATSTWGEAVAVRKLMLQKGWTSVIVVTDPYHTLRAKLAFQRDFHPHDLRVSVIHTRGHWWRPSTWFLSAEGRDVTVREWIKLLGQVLRLEQYEWEDFSAVRGWVRLAFPESPG
ncbi:MAG: YdcF family protein [Anaerolineae bacterium]|nr:YdcF family protein [Anaerolineae bacterium]